MREGAEYFTDPPDGAQRRYGQRRAYFLDQMPAAEAADRFGYSTAGVHQMARCCARADWTCALGPGRAPAGRGRRPERYLLGASRPRQA